ncbi:MAG TPA: hypothetical protein VJV76_00900 [Gaiellaceae bacterium]|nr:hypothetical protein [Gaiellaceae bacterium]
MDREQRLAENEILFREVNERIQELQSDVWGNHEIDFMCECADGACTAVLTLTPAEYEELRSNSRRFAVLPGHQVEDVERVVETHSRYLVVEKNLETVQRVDEADPRS